MTPDQIDKTTIKGDFPAGSVVVPVRYIEEVTPFDFEQFREFSLYVQKEVVKAIAEPEAPPCKLSHKQLQRLTPAERAEYQRRRTAYRGRS